MANVAEIEKMFNETFIPASDHDFIPITSHGDCYQDDVEYKNNYDFENVNESNTNGREIFFAHRQAVPDPEEVTIYWP